MLQVTSVDEVADPISRSTPSCWAREPLQLHPIRVQTTASVTYAASFGGTETSARIITVGRAEATAMCIAFVWHSVTRRPAKGTGVSLKSGCGDQVIRVSGSGSRY